MLNLMKKNKFQKSFFLLGLMIGFYAPVVTAQTAKEALEQYINNAAANFPASLMSNDVSYSEIADLTRELKLDSLSVTALRTYALLFAKAQTSGEQAARQAFIHQCLDALGSDANGGLAQQLIAYLQHFGKLDFAPSAQTKIRDLLAKGTAHFDAFVKVAGFVLNDRQPFQQLLNGSLSRPEKEAVYLALARNGDQGKLAVVQKSIQTLALGDNFIYYVVPVVIYVRQKVTTDYLMDFILQDDQACTPADAEISGQITCAYRLLEMLAPVVKDFPLEITVGGDLDVDNYPAALKEAREWIVEHRQDYELRRDIY